MIRPTKLAGSTCVALASLAVVYGAVAGPSIAPAVGSGDLATLASATPSTTPTSASASPVIARALGVECIAASAALASQIGADPGSTLVVRMVVPGSPAVVAGIQEHDAIVEVDGEPADPESLEAAAESGEAVELELRREGRPIAVTVPATADAAGPFTATDALAPEHPLVRLRELGRQRAMLQDESEDLEARRREIAEARRSAREEAGDALEGLHAASLEEAEAFLAPRADTMRARVDRAFATERAEPLAELGVDLHAILPVGRIHEIDEALHAEAHALEDHLAEQVGLPSGRNGHRIARVAAEASGAMHARVQQPWGALTDRHEHHANGLGRGHAERVASVREVLEATRSELHERIDCAVERTLDLYSKRLNERLQRMELPRGAELEASLEDVAAQMEAWTDGFVTSIDGALEAYEGQIAPARAALEADLPELLRAAGEGQQALARAIEAARAERFVAPEESEGSRWRTDSAARAYAGRLQRELTRAIAEGRDTVRPSSKAIARALADERERSDEAWHDLRQVLRSLHSRASENCWKLDGPHLDGRHTPKPRGRFVSAGR
ncbi:MAG: hypothetical protein AAGB93_10655 [Planctomycetota bacterium]